MGIPVPPSLRRLTAIAALNILTFACGQGVWRDPLAASLDARSARDVESTVDVPVVIESDALLEDSGTPDAAGITAPDQGPDTIECRAECVGGQSCQNGECVCPDGKVFVAGRCVFQCAACKTSNHCSGDRTAVMRETCDSETGRCTTEAVYRCEEGETCDGGTNRCACSGVFCVRENAEPPGAAWCLSMSSTRSAEETGVRRTWVAQARSSPCPREPWKRLAAPARGNGPACSVQPVSQASPCRESWNYTGSTPGPGCAP